MREYVLENGVKKWLILLLLLSAVPGVCSAGVADTYETQAEAHRGIPSNVAIDCIAHGTPAVPWLATGRGAAYTPDNGLTWFSYDVLNGLPSNNLSAIFSIGDRLWVGSSHEEFIASALHAMSDGVTYTDDDGDTWTQVNFGADGLDIDNVWGGDRTVYDITGHVDSGFLNNRVTGADVDWLFFSAFAGGLLASQDGGESWRRIFPSSADSAQFQLTTEEPSLRNRLFACAVDTSHGDSLYLWTGTAGGAFQWVFAPPRDKFYQHLVNAVAFCDTCAGEDGGYVFVAGDVGVSRMQTTGGPFVSRFTLDGLPGKSITAAVSLGDRLLIGTADTTAGVSTGLAVSVDQGETYTDIALPEVVGAHRIISEFAQHSDRLYMAAQNAGLFVSEDSGQVWTRILVDSVHAASSINIANCVSSYADTLLVGTDSGLVELAVDAGGLVTLIRHEYFPESSTSSSRVMRAKAQQFRDDLDNIDSTRVWTVNWPLTDGGTPFVGRRNMDEDSLFYWSNYQVDETTYDVNFWTDTAFVMGTQGIWFSPNGAEPTNLYHVRQYSDSVVVRSLDDDLVTTMAVKGDTVVLGTANGLALTNNRGLTWYIYRPVTDTLGADLVINHTYLSSAFNLAGDFIPAIGVQYTEGGGPARVWASCRPVRMYYGSDGITVGEYRTIRNGAGDSTGFGFRWQTVNKTDYAWNFAFHDSTIFAATNAGLLMHDGSRAGDSLVTTWDTIPLIDTASGQVLVASGTAVYGVGVVDSFLWVGTDAGTVRINLDDLGRQEFFSRVDSTTLPDEVYAFPVPFSPGEGQTVGFHFVVSEPGNVTVEVYDFAMNLVARPIDNIHYDAGSYPSGSELSRTWNGYNDAGDLVAIGVYYFKVQLPSGDTLWGKLAVIP